MASSALPLAGRTARWTPGGHWATTCLHCWQGGFQSTSHVATHVGQAHGSPRVAKDAPAPPATDAEGVDEATSSFPALVGLGAGDSALICDVFKTGGNRPADAVVVTRAGLLAEVPFADMRHRGGPVPRGICVMGDRRADGMVPLYRHPADALPTVHDWSPLVAHCRDEIERVTGFRANHCLVQHYTDGSSSIAEHADKSVDMAPGVPVFNCSFGATRKFTFRAKKGVWRDLGSGEEEEREAEATAEGAADSSFAGLSATGKRHAARARAAASQRPVRGRLDVPLPDGSLFLLGCETNRLQTHAVLSEGRLKQGRSQQLAPEDLARVSLTFRQIHTWCDPTTGRVVGAGARRHLADGEADDDGADTFLNLVHRMGIENGTGANREECYGRGFSCFFGS